jgi:hypothetical protein
MDCEQMNEWLRFQDSALQALRAGDGGRQRGASLVMRMLVLPSFEAAEKWEVCCDASKESQEKYFVALTRWERVTDREKFITPVERLKHPREFAPTFTILRFDLDADRAGHWLERFEALSLTPSPQEGSIGLDGTSFEMEFGDSLFLASRFAWREDGPPAWRELTQACREMLQELRSLEQAG